MSELIIRFIIGGVVVSLFAVIGDVLRPKSFAGLFGAAPSIALATMGLTIAKSGADYAAIEARSMILGAVGFLVYTPLCPGCCCDINPRHHWQQSASCRSGLPSLSLYGSR